MRASLYTHGCRLNQAESQLMHDQLAARGYSVVPWGEPADLGVINTCSVTAEAEAKCRQTIRQFIRRSPDGFTVVVGCFAQTHAEAVAAIPGVDLIIGNQEKMSFLDYVDAGKPAAPVIVRERIDRDDFSLAFVGDLPDDLRANLKVQDGCDFFCDFCLIPFARGRARSRAWDNALAEACELVGNGVRELILTGVNVGTYASAGHDLVDLVDALAALPGLRRLRISSIEPTTVDTGLLDRMADPAHPLLPFLHLPLQNGDDGVLAAMRRKYTAAEYEAFARMAVARVPGLCLGTDIMVGHPAEDEAAWERSRAYFLRLPFAYAHVFPFSERAGTLADRKGQTALPVRDRQRRAAVLRRLSADRKAAFGRDFCGTVREVLFEQPRGDVWAGYTDNFIRVHLVAGSVPADVNLRNTIHPVRLLRAVGAHVEGVLETAVPAVARAS